MCFISETTSKRILPSGVEVGTVAIEVGAQMAEMHMAIEDLGVAIAKLVIVKVVGMNQIDTLVLLHLFTRSTLAWCGRKNDRQQQR